MRAADGRSFVRERMALATALSLIEPCAPMPECSDVCSDQCSRWFERFFDDALATDNTSEAFRVRIAWSVFSARQLVLAH